MHGNKIKEINNSAEGTFYIDSYYDNKLSKNYILATNLDCVKSYDNSNNKVYHKYCDNVKGIHAYLLIIIRKIQF